MWCLLILTPFLIYTPWRLLNRRRPPSYSALKMSTLIFSFRSNKNHKSFKNFSFIWRPWLKQQQAAALASKPNKINKESFSDQPKKVNFEMFSPPSNSTFHAFGQKIPASWYNRPKKPLGKPSFTFGLGKTRRPVGVTLKSLSLPLSKEESKGALQENFTINDVIAWSNSQLRHNGKNWKVHDLSWKVCFRLSRARSLGSLLTRTIVPSWS